MGIERFLVEDLLPLLGALAVLAVAVVASLDWWRRRGPERAAVAIAVGLLGVVAVLSRLGAFWGYSHPWVGPSSGVAFLGSAYALLVLRYTLLPFPRRVLLAAGTLVALLSAMVVIVRVRTAPGTDIHAGHIALVVVATIVWAGCLGEPIVRFWTTSRHLPAVQRARLRSIAAGYTSIVVVQFGAFVAPSQAHPRIALALQMLWVAGIALLFVSVVPPQGVRRLWSQREHHALLEAGTPLFLAGHRGELAAGALEWATRLVGADEGFLTAGDATVLAARGISADDATTIAAALGPPDGDPVADLASRTGRQVVRVPLPLDAGAGSLVILSGPLTPPFGSHEIATLRHYAAATATALDHAGLTEMRNAFLTAMSHEVRTPLTSIVGTALTLQGIDREHLSLADHKRLVGQLVANAERLERLLVDLLDLDRLSRGSVVTRLEPTDLGDLVRRVVGRTTLPSVRVIVMEIESVVVEVDPGMVERIIDTLLGNVSKHAPDSAKAWVRVERTPDGALLAVEDGGSGVAPELRELIFSPFRKGPGIPQHSPGTGAGLAVVARFAELHGGRAWAEDRPGGGASFRVLFPAVLDTNVAPFPARTTTIPATRAGGL